MLRGESIGSGRMIMSGGPHGFPMHLSKKQVRSLVVGLEEASHTLTVLIEENTKFWGSL